MKYLLINGSLRIVCALCICCLYSCEDESDKVIIDETQGIEYEIGDEYIDKYGNITQEGKNSEAASFIEDCMITSYTTNGKYTRINFRFQYQYSTLL